MAKATDGAIESRHEPGQVATRPILLAAVALVIVLIAVLSLCGIAAGLAQYERAPQAVDSPRGFASQRQTDSAREADQPPAPALQTVPALDLAAMRDETQTALASYRWVDRRAGVVQIPIERAMELMAAGRTSATPDIKTSEAAK